MKVLHIIDSGGVYGAETMLLNLMREQVRLGMKPVLASIGTHGEGEKPVEAAAHRLDLRVRPFRMRPGPNWAGAFKILRFAHQEQFSILHSHGYKGNILLGLVPRKVRGFPLVATLHGWTWVGGCNRMLIYEWLDAFSLRFADRVVLVNQMMTQHPRLRRFSPGSIEVVENGIPLDGTPGEGHLRTDILEFTQKGFILGAVGRLSPEKGFDILLSGMASLVGEGFDLRLVILGEGGQRKELSRQIMSLGLTGRVLMPGYVADAKHYLAHFDLFILPSLAEGLPMVLLEAMAAAVPIVASRVGGIPVVLDQGRAGLLVKPRDVASLVAGIRAVVEDPQSARQRCSVALDRATSLYSTKVMGERYLTIYRQIITEYKADSKFLTN